jgi:adenosylhomocysteine nucleosidase
MSDAGTAVIAAPRVLVVAAESFELRHIPHPPGWRFAANGPGPELAAAAMDAVDGRFEVLVSTGLCGALIPGLRVGDIFVATSVNGIAASVPRCSRPFASGPLVSIGRVAGTAAEKRALAASGAMAVDMEAAAVAERARAAGAAFFCIRAVSDVADDDFALDLNAGRGEDGRFSAVRIVKQALRRPTTGVPQLFRLRRNARVASKALGEFFAHCEF